MQIADSHWFKAVDSGTGEVVGYAGCLAPEGVKVSGGVSAGARVEGDGALPEIVDGESLGRWDGVLGEMKRECLGGREDVWCESFFFLLYFCCKQLMGEFTSRARILS